MARRCLQPTSGAREGTHVHRLTRIWRGAPLAVATAGLLLAMLPASVSAAESQVTIYAEMGSCSWYGFDAGNKKTIAFVWKDSGGALKSKQTVKSRADGSYDSKCDTGEAMEAGDTLKATIGTKSHTFTLPTLTLSSNRDNNTAFGVGPANSSVHVTFESTTGFGISNVSFDYTEPTDGAGGYSHDFTSDADMRGWDWLNVEWVNGHGDLAYVDHYTPTLKIWVGRPDGVSAWGYLNPGAPIDVSLQDSSHIVKGQASDGADRNGYWEGDFVKPNNGGFVRAIAGDFIDATPYIGSDANWEVPAIPVSATASNDKVSGTCQPSEGWEVSAYSNVAKRFGTTNGMTNASGAFHTDLTSQMNLQSGDKVDVYCKLVSGDVVARHITVP
jgi:hypothetical protein